MNNVFPSEKFNFDNQDLMSVLSDFECEILTKNSTVTCFQTGQEIFKEGTVPEGIYRVKKGKVKKVTATNFGTEHIFYICREQEYLGYHALLSEEVYPDSAVALTDCKIQFIPKLDFLNVVSSSHELSRRLLKNLSHEFGVFLNATKLLAKHTVRERTAINLLILNNKFKESTNPETEIIINREDLANMVGTATESLVRMLKEFKEDKFIYTEGRVIYINNVEALLKVSNIS